MSKKFRELIIPQVKVAVKRTLNSKENKYFIKKNKNVEKKHYNLISLLNYLSHRK